MKQLHLVFRLIARQRRYAGQVIVPYYGTTLSGQTKTIASISKTTVYYVWETSGLNTTNYSIDKWKAAACHENDHALGYAGHDTSSTIAIMNPYLNTY